MDKKFIAVSAIAIVAISVAVYLYWQMSQVPPVEEVLIGTLAPMTGYSARSGTRSLRYYNQIADWYNEGGGIKSLNGAKIRIIVGDDQGQADVAAAEAERLITQEGVSVICGPYFSMAVIAAGAIFDRYEVPGSVDGTSPDIPKQGYQYLFRSNNDDYVYVRDMYRMLQDITEKYGHEFETIGWMYESSAFGMGHRYACEAWNDDPEIGGLEVVADIQYEKTTLDVTSEVMTFKTTDPDAIFAASYVPDATLFTTTMVSLDYVPKLLVGEDTGHTDPDYFANEPNAEFVASRASWNRDVTLPLSILFMNKYEEAYPGELMVDMRSHDSFLCCIYALEDAGSDDPKDIRQAFVDAYWEQEMFCCPWPAVEFDETGQNIHAASLMIQNSWDEEMGQNVYFTVWPWDAATKDIVYPAPPYDSPMRQH
jgi:branched-chain amino acid transport system substrate-binding protein